MTVKHKKQISFSGIALIAFALIFGFAVSASAQTTEDVMLAPVSVEHSLNVVGGVFDALGIQAGGGTEATSFIEFEGGLETPSTEGYSPGLTQATTAREFILNVTNFALGFLGLIAVIIIIYGGVLYLTATGREEQAGKGKKSIMYAVIGLLLIMGSYALVNTILQAPSGVEGGELAGSAPEGTTGVTSDQISARRAQFYRASTEIRTIAEDFYTAYLHYSEIKTAIDSLREFTPEKTSHQAYREDMEAEIAILNRIKTIANPLDDIYTEADNKIRTFYQVQINLSNTAYNEALDAAGESEPPEGTFAGVLDLTSNVDELWQANMAETVPLYNPGLNDLRVANQRDYARDVLQEVSKIEELQASIQELTSENIGVGVDDAFDALIGPSGDLTTLASGSLTQAGSEPTLSNPEVTNTEIVRILEKMAILSKAVEQIQFVDAVITASVTEGSAPLIVNFDGLRSLDPSNVSIPSGNFAWEFGDGSSETNVSVTHNFEEVGTYIVKLTVTSPNSDRIAAGVAYTTITVREPAVKINFSANVAGEDFVLRQYDSQTGRLLTEINTLKLTSAEAENVTFTAENVEAEDLQSVRWNFGDIQPEILGTGQTIELQQTVSFPEEGNYQIIFEAVDRRNNSSRKIVNIVVGSPNARIQVFPGTIGDLQTEFSFDGGNSRSDAGKVSNYEWNYDQADTELLSVTDTDEVLKLKFLSPSEQNSPKEVSLTVTDNLGQTDTSSVKIKIESRPPVAQFFIIHEEPHVPGLVVLDASGSYDPDGETELQYAWTIDDIDINNNNLVEVISADPNNKWIVVEFGATGVYRAALTVTDTEGLESEPSEREIDIEDILDISWNPFDTVTAQLDDNGEAEVTLNLISNHGKAYEIDWGDMEIETGNITSDITAISHTYREAKVFNVKASVFDELDNENTNTRKIFIGSADTPIAVIGGEVAGNPIINSSEGIEVARTDNVLLDANASRNVDGTGRRLKYTWDFGDGTRSTQKEITHTFREIGDYTVTLTVSDESGRTANTGTDTLTVTVVGEPPSIRGLSVVPVSTGLTTPVQVNLTAIGATDPDGRITKYRWYFYDITDPENVLGTQVTALPNATMTIGTKGREGDQVTYEFVVEITDDENQTTSSKERLVSSPTITVTNGPNKPPTASFTVDRTSIMVGESINFTSSSTDPDGQITDYIWDFEGDGFANNFESLSANESYTYLTPAREGLAVRLKVIDDKGSVAYSDPVTIYIDSPLLPPTAAFTSAQQDTGTTVKFTDNSTVDPGSGPGVTISTWKWDFDINTDSNGDGLRDNDNESSEQNPTHDYVEYGIKRAKLTVEDSAGNSASVTNFVNVKAPAAAAPETTTAVPLDARMVTNPTANVVDGKIHIHGTSGNVTFNYSSSQGDIQTYIIDKNVYFDTNGNGVNYDDEDHVSSTPGSWTTDFDSSWGNVRVRLTVVGNDGKKDTVEKDIVFDASADSSMMANTLGAGSGNLPAVLVTLLGFAILTLSILRFKKEKINDQ
jgi:PKD repeat protein